MLKTIPKLAIILIMFIAFEALAFVMGWCTGNTQADTVIHVLLFLVIAIIVDMM